MLSNFYIYIICCQVSNEEMQMQLETTLSYNAIIIHHIKKKKDGEKTSKIIFFYQSKQDHLFLR